MADVRYTGKIDPFTEGYVKKRVRELIGKFGITPSDVADIQQILFLKLAKYLPSDDPDHPQWKAFVATTAKRCIANVIRDRHAEKRDHRRVGSIHVVIGVSKEGPIEQADTIGDHQVPTLRLRGRPRTEQELIGLRLDLEERIAELEDEQHREFCRRLKQDSISEIARDMNIPRTTANSWLRKLRQKFEDTGLEEYL